MMKRAVAFRNSLLAAGYLLSFAVVIAFSALFIGRHAEVDQQLQAIHYAQYEPVWHNTAFYVDYHRFLESAERYVRGGLPAIRREDVVKRFEVFYSRFAVLDADAIASVVLNGGRPGVEQKTARLRKTIAQLKRRLGQLDALQLELEQLQPGDVETVSRLREQLQPIQPLAVTLVLDSFNLYRVLVQKQQELENRSSSSWLLIFSGLVSGALLFLLLLSYHIRHRGRSKRELARANHNLVQKIAETDELNRQLHRHATCDELTGLWNRRGLAAVLANANRSQDSGPAMNALCFIDLDEFKVINDTCGHAAGDLLLVKVAQSLRAAVPQAEAFCRFGGDEFVIVWESISGAGFVRQLRKLEHNFDRFQFVFEGRKFDVGASIGALQFQPGKVDREQLITLADTACYIAKERGGRRFHLHSDADQSVLCHQRQMGWLSEMNNAFDENRFRLYVQPIVAAQPGSDARPSWEVLIRMLNRQGELLSPGEFLSAAERYSMIARIDRWVIEQVFDWIRDNPERMSQLQTLHINLSGVTIGQSDIVGFIRDCANSRQLDPALVCLEVTETAAAGREAAGRLRELAGCGFGIALDDFGSGFSSFEYLRNLPVDVLKIDGMFVRDVSNDPMQREFVRTINNLAHALGKTTVAEFVECQSALDVLAELGVDYVQGYHTGKPEPMAGEHRRAAGARVATAA